MDNHLHDEPSSVSAEAGQVIVDGPGNIVFDLTPGAAEETALRLSEADRVARQQGSSPAPDA